MPLPYIVDTACPPDKVYFLRDKSLLRFPVWRSREGKEFYTWQEIPDDHLRGIVDLLLSKGSEQYYYQRDSDHYDAFIELKRRGLWTDADALRSRLEGVVKR